MQQDIIVYKAEQYGFFPTPATEPTLYFIGVTTGQSSIMKVFPAWANAMGLKAVIKGIDIGIHEKPEVYRQVVSFIKNDPLSYGALVTTHKLDLYAACSDMFEYLDPYALKFHEMSCISKKDGKLCGHAKDPISSGLAMSDFVPKNWWKKGGDFYVIGAGGSAISMGSYLMRKESEGDRPKRIIVSNRSQPRLSEIERLFTEINPGDIECKYYLCPTPQQNDNVLAGIKPYSVIVNATGLGKDRPGSPLTDSALFPENSIVWEINYRGELNFMKQAAEQKEDRNLQIEDGWRYFIYGWTQVIEEVFHYPIDGKLLDVLDGIASAANKNGKLFDYQRGFICPFDLKTGFSTDAFTTKRYLGQMNGMFSNDAAMVAILERENPLVYEFYEMGAPEVSGALAMGTTRLYPGKVGDEYYFTKGHFHCILDTAEIYYCMSGEGYMLLENPEGDWKLQAIRPGAALYVPPRYAHRMINTGSDVLVTFFVFRADAGHDYGTIETKGYRKLLVERNGIPTVIDNPKWK
ncbi:MAG: hypothetical protein LUF88_10340 [Bacteroides fragilis]|nr:hypothetical protein [Bacteroides fragilis]